MSEDRNVCGVCKKGFANAEEYEKHYNSTHRITTKTPGLGFSSEDSSAYHPIEDNREAAKKSVKKRLDVES